MFCEKVRLDGFVTRGGGGKNFMAAGLKHFLKKLECRNDLKMHLIFHWFRIGKFSETKNEIGKARHRVLGDAELFSSRRTECHAKRVFLHSTGGACGPEQRIAMSAHPGSRFNSAANFGGKPQPRANCWAPKMTLIKTILIF